MKRKHGVMETILFASIKLNNKGIKILPKILWAFNRVICGCDIHFQAGIEDGVKFGHNGLGTVISKNSSIGTGSIIMQNVTLGGSDGKKREHNGRIITAPQVGKNVLIGAGAKLIGPIIIGDNVKIGANSVVTKDVQANSVAVGVPVKIIRNI